MDIKKILSLLFHRTALVALLLLLQIALLVWTIYRFFDYFFYFYFLCVLLSLVVVLHIINKQGEPGYKIAWIIPILLAPVFGGLVYLLCGGNGLTRQERWRMERMDCHMRDVLDPDKKAEALAPYGWDAVNQACYLEEQAHCPLYTNTDTRYFPLGDDAFQPMLEELRRAERYIFLEYFIIAPGKFWNAVLEVLEEKVAQGVDVRVIYDDVGCLYTLPKHYAQTLRDKGIRCYAFNRFIPVLSVRLNNRDHRKFCIVDGHTAFTGGINLADEYINEEVHYGHWKDSAILVKGEAAWSMTVMFLTMWENVSGREEDISGYRPGRLPTLEKGGTSWVQPYADTPLDGEPVGETVYRNLISKAKKYLYIMTPYLIISDSVNSALCAAAKGGVDVRLMTPHIPDKKTIFEATQAHYEPLLQAGVRIFEYTPGFLHAKNFVSDDLFATVGTVNLDYRSMFLQFEDGIWLCGGDTVLDVKADFLATQKQSEEITLEKARSYSFFRLLFRAVLRIFAPLM